MTYEHLMIDIETLGTNATPPILSIGAVFFSEEGLGEEFYRNISLESCIKAGLQPEADTIKWWMKQDKEVRDEAFSGKENIQEVLISFMSWVKDKSGLNPDLKVWANGANADGPWIRNACDKIWADPSIQPWQFYQEMCYRTIKRINPLLIEEQPPDNQQAHNPLADAKYQAEYLSRIFDKYNLWGYI